MKEQRFFLNNLQIWQLQIERVNFLSTHVAQYQRGVVGSQTAPASDSTNREPNPFEVNDSL
jgi:hypothetical protein